MYFLEGKYNEFWFYKFKYLNTTNQSKRPTCTGWKLNFNFAIFHEAKEKLAQHMNFIVTREKCSLR